MSGINNYFSNNNIFNGTEIPTQGKFDVGDIIVNIGENAEEEPMWMCIEAGEPGVWKVVGKVGDIDLSGLLTENKDLVGAINELFQNANNGKELIANAIGEPLSSEDTFSAMSSDINGLLSTFKTNMMNNGVTVESNDKFKSLIDKIATLVDSEGKGVQFVVDVARTNEDGKLYVSGLPFKPIFFLTYLTDPVSSLSPDTRYYNLCFNIGDITTSVRYNNGTFQNYSSIDSITDDGFIASVYHSYNHWDSCGYEHTYYVIGVGEEDTTLRDSLASILQEEGVSVTEEDDMASLIGKVDEEFDRKNANSGLDIISATELPATGKENQICVITDNPVDIFRITPNVDYVSNDGNEIVVYTGTPYTSGLQSGYFLAAGSDNSITEYYFDRINQNSERKSSYIYINSTWKQMTKAYIAWLENGVFMNSNLFGGHTTGRTADGDGWATINSAGITYTPNEYFSINVGIATLKRIDFSLYKKVTLKIKTNTLSGKIYLMAVNSTSRLTESSFSNLTHYSETKHQSTVNLSANNTLYYDVDISSWSGNYYLAVVYSSPAVDNPNGRDVVIIDVLVS